MKILIVTPFAEPEKGACIIRMNSFYEYFTKKGHKVKILAPSRKGISEVRGVKRYSSIRELIKLVLLIDYDVLIGTSPPLTHSFFAFLTASLRRKSKILDIRDPWTYEYQRLGIYAEKNTKLQIYKSMEKISYFLANKIFVVTSFAKNILVNQGAKGKKIVLVPNGTIPEIFKRDEKQGRLIRRRLGIPKNATVILYAGAFIKKDLDKMLEHLSDKIKKMNVRVLLLLSAEPNMGHEWNKMKQLLKRIGIAEKTIFVDLPKIDYKEVHKYFSAADFGLNPLPDAMDYCIPAKTYDYLACGLPIIAKGPKKSALKNLIEENQIGFYFSNWKKLKSHFPEILRNKGVPNALRNKCVQLAKKKFDRKRSSEIALREIKALAELSGGLK